MREFKGLYQRGNVYWFRYQVAGERQSISLETGDLSTAIDKAKKLRANPSTRGADTVDGLKESFLAHKLASNEYSEGSVHGKRYILKLLGERFAGRPITQIMTSDMQAWYNLLKKKAADPKAPWTANTYLTASSAFFRWCKDEARVLDRNPCTEVKMISIDTKPFHKYCRPEERDALIANCDDPQMKFVLYCGFFAGLRKKEIIEARPDWFDLENGLLHVRKTPTFTPKFRDERAIDLATPFKTFLATYPMNGTWCMAPEKKKGRSKYRYDFRLPFDNFITAMSKKELKVFGNKPRDFTWLTPHNMRHTFASILVSRGASIYVVAEWMGDEVKTVQKHYGRLMPGNPQINLQN